MAKAMTFADRQEAGKLLARKLLRFKDCAPIVLALPRGGVAVGFEIARALAAPLDLVLVQKLGAPDQPELAIGALADGANPELVTDSDLIGQLAVPPALLEQIMARAREEIARRQTLYRSNRPPAVVTNRTAILVDDGIATGATMRAALHATRRHAPRRLVLAVPVAPSDTIRRLGQEADEIVCLLRPHMFTAVGRFYHRFPQLDDQEVLDLLAKARGFATRASS